jgi:DNA-binding NarL/FixJ family response regulator
VPERRTGDIDEIGLGRTRSDSSVRLVLADDEALLRRGLRVVLETDPRITVVAEAADGAELIEAIGAYRPDVVLIDVQMPGTDGLTALRRIRTLPDQPAAAMLTTFDVDEYVVEALDLGANGFLLKDAEPDTLVRAVLDLAAGGAVLDPRITARLLPLLRASGLLRAAVAVPALTVRERQVLELIAAGRSNAAIARRLGLTEATVKGYVSAVFGKLGVRNRVQAAVTAQRLTGIADRSA